ncbi:M20/M25/M40 family metallo-hydrolase [Prolixibacteraceae bacterium Z1-6]|uniref:M20/M25/M40 family metallo-hydrolase n=1 Tax=Draconibacterium aestuarii TaxID=2998507 RepID=A0A9X3J6U2_9BACT|nr:M20/M25/M40 family metallo-hydrolase [Prolixibacteraceae bacterium Z1-6]
MFLTKITQIFYVLCLISFSSFAQTDALKKIDKANLERHLKFIASDELQGRKLGTEVDGLGITANYIADFAKQTGLKPGADNYFQTVDILSVKPGENSFIEIQNTKGKSLFKTNSLIAIGGPQATQQIEMKDPILLGFGENEIPDVNGKVVVVAQGNAELFKKGNVFGWNRGMEQRKITMISEKKPEAIIIVTNPNDKENKTFKQIDSWINRETYSLKYKARNDQPLVILTKPDFTDKLLGGKGKFKKYLTEIAEGKITNADLPANKKLNLKVEKQVESVAGKNVIGVVEGSDPQLKNEYVVFMAHYDHIGMGKDGEVFNGADDNGSGTVAIMEVAKAFMSLETKPKRSIVFLWVTGEEIGHFGSMYYCDHLIFPLEKTVAAINLDMVGRVYDGPRDDVWKDSPKKVKDFDGLYTLSNDVWPKLAEINDQKCKELGLVPDTSLPKDPFLRASDHYHFHKNGVPILNYATGYHADYHKVGDEVEKINFDKIKRVADLCFLVGLEVANTDHIEIAGKQE